MNIPLKKKYISLNEPKDWYNKSGKYNMGSYGQGGNNKGVKKFKKESKPLGFSGKTVGEMVRKYTMRLEKKR